MANDLQFGDLVVKLQGIPKFRDPRKVTEVIDAKFVMVERVNVMVFQAHLDKVGHSAHLETFRGTTDPTPEFTAGSRVRLCSTASSCVIATVIQQLPAGGALRIREETPDGPRIRDVSARLVKPLD